MTALPDHAGLLAHFRQHDPRIADVMNAVGPHRLRPDNRYFQVLARAIVSQQISTRAADTIYSRFAKLFENRRPRPGPLLSLAEDDLRAAGLSRQKIVYMRDLARHFEEGRIRPRRFRSMDNHEIIEQLVQVKGIGRWTVEMFLIFSLNRPDVLPVDDLGLRSAVQKIYNLKAQPDARTLKTIGAPWNPYESVATWYAWQFLRLPEKESR